MAAPREPFDPAARPGGAILLATKLHVPPVPPAFVARRWLADRLDAGRARPLTLVCAPPGFGKSVLVAEWCRRGGRTVGWLSLDDGDNDPVRFWRHLAAALDEALGGASATAVEAVDDLVGGDGDVPSDAVTSALLNIAAAADEIVIVLDDYHVISDEAVHATVRFLLDHSPPALNVVVVSRADPPLFLSRRRARGELTELRAADLRFGTSETAEFLRAVTGSELDESAIATLTARTEGWIAGLQLVGLTLEGHADVDSFVEGFSGSHRFVVDYLTEEVLDRQPRGVCDFLLETSILGRLSGPLCDAVTGRSDSQALLESIERANLFLVPLDDVRGWWRYHQLFADLLQVRLRQRPAQEVHDLHRRSGEWHEARGLAHAAIRHALGAGDPAWAARIIERHADEMLLGHEGATLRRWAAELPAEFLGSRRLHLAQARMATYAGRIPEAEAFLADADGVSGASGEDPLASSVDPAASPFTDLDLVATLLRAFIAHLRGDADGAEALASGALASVGGDDGSAIALIARWHLATAPWLRGDVDAAAPRLAANIDRWRAGGQLDRAAWGAHHLGWIQREQGRPDAALATYRGVLEHDAARAGTPAPTAGVAHVGMAELAYLSDDLPTARRHAEEGIALCRHFVYAQALATGLSALAGVLRAGGDDAGAVDLMTEAMRVGPGAEVVDLLNPVPTRRARLLLALGDDRAATEWIARRGLDATDEPRHQLEPAYLLLARLLIGRGRGEEARRLLERMGERASSDGRLGDLVEVEALRALALDETGDADGAVGALAGALTLAASQSNVRVLVDEGAPMAALIARLVAAGPAASGVPDGFIARVARAFGEDASATSPEGAGELGGLVVGLTGREVEVLAEVAAGKRNREIAADLYVSLDTVKKHMTHIFGKLGVDNRTAAIARARELGLLP